MYSNLNAIQHIKPTRLSGEAGKNDKNLTVEATLTFGISNEYFLCFVTIVVVEMQRGDLYKSEAGWNITMFSTQSRKGFSLPGR